MPPLLSEPVGTKISKKFTIQIFFIFFLFFLNNNMVMSQNNNKTGKKKKLIRSGTHYLGFLGRMNAQIRVVADE